MENKFDLIQEDLNAAFFENLSKKEGVYIIFDSQNVVAVTDISVTEFTSYYGIDRIPFSVVFFTDNENVWPQGIYYLLIDHNKIKDLFLVPLGKEGNKIKYEAVFS